MQNNNSKNETKKYRSWEDVKADYFPQLANRRMVDDESTDPNKFARNLSQKIRKKVEEELASR
ncbi:hypothetical protein [Maridesulfovibrio sp.]|uniref:hypothetical protein n=1 Tax=Maridesulfovibrio sp. TaxID=2795000 RepID=UPI0029CA4D06|nr:hypothetical protein [Maridesulfovibrio sp.]